MGGVMKILDTREYVSVLKDLTEEGKVVNMTVAGNSMSPFLIHERDAVCFERRNRELCVGDIVFYQRKNGQYIMHRICRIEPEGFYLVGDAQTEIEGPIEGTQIFAIITKARRNGICMGPGDFWWEFFEHVWIRIIPLRKPLVTIYGALCRFRERK